MTARDREVTASLRETARAWRNEVRWALFTCRAFRGSYWPRPALTAARRYYKRANRLACGGGE